MIERYGDLHHHRESFAALLSVLHVVIIIPAGQHTVRRDDEANDGRSHGCTAALNEAWDE